MSMYNFRLTTITHARYLLTKKKKNLLNLKINCDKGQTLTFHDMLQGTAA